MGFFCYSISSDLITESTVIGLDGILNYESDEDSIGTNIAEMPYPAWPLYSVWAHFQLTTTTNCTKSVTCARISHWIINVSLITCVQ